MNGFRDKLRAATALGALAAVGCAIVGFAAVWPLPDLAGEAARRAGGGVAAVPRAARAGGAAPLASYAPAWSRDLRRPLSDAPANTVVQSAEPAGATLPVRLVGTIVGPARPRGIFVTSFGQMELRGVGEKAGGAEVLRIDERTATLSLAGQPVTIRVEKADPPIPGFAPAAAASPP